MNIRPTMAIKMLLAVPVALAILLMYHPLAKAMTYEYKQYTVRKGDTLWSITKRELVDAYQWPMVWMENQRINDPDLIYPGQIILIPIRAIDIETLAPPPGVTITPEETGAEIPEAPPEIEYEEVLEKPEYETVTRKIIKKAAVPIVTKEVLIASGYITKYPPHAGKVQGGPVGRMIYGNEDVIYIGTRNRVEKGQKFYVTRQASEVEHPITRESAGWAIMIVALVETLEAGDDEVKARVLENYESIMIGDLLDPYIEYMIPLAPPSPRKPEVNGHILRSGFVRIISAREDVLFIDKGSKDGIKVGDVFITLMENTNDTVNGVIQVVNVRNNTSLVIAQKSRREIKRGDVFRGFMIDVEDQVPDRAPSEEPRIILQAP